jgi:hypothetical protein
MEMTQNTHYATGCKVADLPANLPEEIADDLIFEGTKIDPDIFLLKRGNAKLFPLQNLSILKAQMKNGKTFAAVMFASAYLAGTWENQLQTATDDDGKAIDGAVLYVDTEQSKASTKKIRRRITKLFAIARNVSEGAGAKYTDDDYKNAVFALNRRLYVANVRAHNVETRRKHIAQMLEYAKGVKLVIIDGIKDICNDFNNIADVADTMDVVTRWALQYDVHILCVLHENPSSDKARGHLGTELYNKATEIINVKREENFFRVTWEAIREGAGVEPLFFCIGDFPADVPVDVPADVPADGKGKGKDKTGETPVQKNTGGQRFRTQNKQTK